MLSRILTTPALLFHQPRLFRWPANHWLWGLLQGKAWSCISQVSYAGLTIFSCRASVHYLSTSVCITCSLYPRLLITIISDLLPSKKQIIGIRGKQPNRRHQQQLSVSLFVSVCPVSFLNFPMISSPKTSNGTIQGIAATAAVHWRVL